MAISVARAAARAVKRCAALRRPNNHRQRRCTTGMLADCPADASAAGAPAETDAAAGSAGDPALPDGPFSF
eukprot:5790720-Pyramimonas_sp.AAC.1